MSKQWMRVRPLRQQSLPAMISGLPKLPLSYLCILIVLGSTLHDEDCTVTDYKRFEQVERT